MRSIVLVLGLALAPLALSQLVTPTPAQIQEVRQQFLNWNAALATLNPATVAAMYHPDAVLLPTVSNEVRNTPAEILDYFTMFLKKKPQGVINEDFVKILGDNLAAYYGIYTFTLTDDKTGMTSQVGARFSYTYIKQGDKWLILEHHSSALPELASNWQQAVEAEVTPLFDAWNAALATLDPIKVADMYAPDAVLLPTVSNQVRDTREKIVAYFTDFLKKKPQGVIDTSIVRVMSPTLAARYGIYTFTLTDDKTGKSGQVGARYSYTYIKIGGKWLIQEHHSSALPEPTVTEVDIRNLFTKWNDALQTKDPVKVADLYAPNGLLLPTVSNQVRDTREKIIDYFTMFLKKSPKGTINESWVRIMGPSTAAHYGIYTFDLTDEKTGVVAKVGARFSYTYTKVGNDWLILEHHSSALPEVPMPERETISNLFNVWNNALATLNPATVADLYHPDAVLLPTVSNEVRNTPAEILEYFTMFLKKKPQGVINESHVKVLSPTLAAHYGIYTFTLTDDKTGEKSQVGARFSYTYTKAGDKWLILEHHSSVLPESAPPPTEAQVAELFNVWNSALATGMPDTVADLYAPNAVLLATVSNVPRTSRAAIVAYFTDFLKKKPQGKIDQSFIKVMSNTMAAHYGVYTFTFTDATGKQEQVQARFSYTYAKMGDKWLIVEHHSSAMPEGTRIEAIALPSEADVRNLFNQWNAALATLDPIKVADMYAPDAVLLPTVSNQVRDTRAKILDYFTMFLKKKPQGVINESHVNILSSTLAAHYGIYTFSLTDEKTGKVSQVGARFSYTYERIGNKWLIVEHHSSALPEPAGGSTSPTPAAAMLPGDVATEDDVARYALGLGLGVGLGTFVILALMIAYVIVLVKNNAQPTSATVVLEPHGVNKV